MAKKRDDSALLARRAAARAHTPEEIAAADQALLVALERERAAAEAAILARESLPAPKRRSALLIINTKSGPNDDSILHLRSLVQQLEARGFWVDVRVKLRKRQARKDASSFAKAGCELVIAAGGDGTVAAVARGLIGTKAALGIVPLGTYNNLAASLGVPSDPAAAVALIAAGPTRAIDVGVVRCTGRRKSRPFFELVSIGVLAALMPAGQEAKDGRWRAAAELLPAAVQMEPAAVTVSLDGARDLEGRALLVTVANAPCAGPALELAPDARVDDGALDVALYRDMAQPALALHFAGHANVGAPADERIERTRGRRVEVRAEPPLPIAADAKVIGSTPARIEIVPGALRVIAGAGPGLAQPVPERLVAAALAVPVADSVPATPPGTDTPETPASDASPVDTAAQLAATAANAAATVVTAAASVAEPVREFAERQLLRQDTSPESTESLVDPRPIGE